MFGPALLSPPRVPLYCGVPAANPPRLQRLHLLKTRTTTALMKLNDDSHNTTMIQWSGKLINASFLLP